MNEIILGAILIMILRIADVTLGTIRTLLVVQAKKIYAALIGFVEVLIWIYAMKYIVGNMETTLNLFAYALGFSIGNYLGITLEEKIGIGYIQVNIISKTKSAEIALQLRRSKFGITLLPAEGMGGALSVIVAIVRRKDQKNLVNLVDSIDSEVFISIQHSHPYRGFINSIRK